jgi:hypothetical protein
MLTIELVSFSQKIAKFLGRTLFKSPDGLIGTIGLI